MMKKLEIDLADLTISFEDRTWGMSYYLDLETGQVVAVSDEIQGQLEDLQGCSVLVFQRSQPY